MTDVFLKAFLCDDLHCKNISNWMSLFAGEEYSIKIVCPKKQAGNFAEKFKEAIVQDGENLELKNHESWLDRVSANWIGAAVANLTCSANAKSKYFWNIDADSWVDHESGSCLRMLQKIETICASDGLDVASLDYHRTSNRKEWLDHWSFGVAFQNVDFDLREHIGVLDQKDFECAWGCNMDRIADQIRKKSNTKKIKTFAMIGATLYHRHVSHCFGKDQKSVSNRHEIDVVPYPDVDDYMVLT